MASMDSYLNTPTIGHCFKVSNLTMNEDQQSAIESQMATLVEVMQPIVFETYLSNKGYLNDSECQVVSSSGSTNSHKITKIFSIVKWKEGSWELIIKFLKDHKYDWLATRLLRGIKIVGTAQVELTNSPVATACATSTSSSDVNHVTTDLNTLINERLRRARKQRSYARRLRMAKKDAAAAITKTKPSVAKKPKTCDSAISPEFTLDDKKPKQTVAVKRSTNKVAAATKSPTKPRAPKPAVPKVEKKIDKKPKTTAIKPKTQTKTSVKPKNPTKGSIEKCPTKKVMKRQLSRLIIDSDSE